ncbi:MAG TPA: tyrosine-type recombinase/integrase [Vicinamibacterales bacterium]|nr:tyrosine-type recombinase/integrase [Vicinamibacterales bacterium]
MLESLHVRPDICVRLRSGPLGSWVDPFVDALAQAGYTAGMRRRYVHAAGVFSTWLSRHRIAVADVDEHVVARFVSGRSRWHPPSRPRGRLNELVTGVRGFATFLWAQGVANRQSRVARETDIDRWIGAFITHLTRVRGAASGTRRIYERYARGLLQACWPDARVDWSAVTAERVASFVRTQVDTLSRTSSRAPVTAVRSFVRFLVSSGVVRVGLEGAVPTVRQWKFGTLPRALTTADVQRILQTVEATTPDGARDYAILLLLSRLGLRAGEVAALCVRDIDWREGSVQIRPGKTGRERRLPLPHDVGVALVRTLKTRHTGASREAVFLRARPPYRPLTAAAITSVAQRALRRADVTIVRPGAHSFRHTVASQLVQHGVSLKAVADVLGHAELDTTAIYAKLDVATLLTVALPWPGSAQ